MQVALTFSRIQAFRVFPWLLRVSLAGPLAVAQRSLPVPVAAAVPWRDCSATVTVPAPSHPYQFHSAESERRAYLHRFSSRQRWEKRRASAALLKLCLRQMEIYTLYFTGLSWPWQEPAASWGKPTVAAYAQLPLSVMADILDSLMTPS